MKTSARRCFRRDPAPRDRSYWLHRDGEVDNCVHVPRGGHTCLGCRCRGAPALRTRTGEVDREVLRKSIEDDPNLLSRIEAVIHPLVAEDRRGFLDEAQSEMVVVDVPLLFETGGDRSVDVTVVVSATADSQRDRVLARPGMTEERLQSILSRQMPDAEKRRRADFVIETLGLEEARRQVHDVIEAIKARSRDARDRSRY